MIFGMILKQHILSKTSLYYVTKSKVSVSLKHLRKTIVMSHNNFKTTDHV